MPPRRYLTNLVPASPAIRSHPWSWRFAAVCFVVLVVVLLSIRTVPALAQLRPGAISDASHLSRVVVTSGELLFRDRYGYRLPPDADVLVQSLTSHSPFQQRFAVISILAQRGETRALIAALGSSDPSVRIVAIQVLGWRQAPDSIEALVSASFDADPSIREAAINALGETGSWLALPRLQQAQIVQNRYYIQQAAYLAEQKISGQLAEQLGIGAPELHSVAVAPNAGLAYAVTSQGLYVRQARGWARLDNVPDVMTGVIATSADGSIVYLGTMSGLYRSLDSGSTWEHVSALGEGNPDVRVTAVLVNPMDSNQVFAALASSMSTAPVVSTPLGIYESPDRGDSWAWLPDSPQEYMTTRLSLDSTAPQYLFGATGVGTWRYTMSESTTNTRSN